MTSAQRRKDLKRSKSIIRRYVAPILFALAFISSSKGVFMCPNVEMGLCCKKFVVMDGQRLGQDCKFVMTNRITPFSVLVFTNLRIRSQLILIPHRPRSFS